MKKYEYENLLNLSLLSVFLFGLFLSVPINYFIICILLIISHEYGHYLIAKKYGLYAGFEISIVPHIKLKKRFPNRWAYLSGFVCSLIVLPIAIFLLPFWWFYLIVSIGVSVLDFAVFIFYGKLSEENE